MRAPTPAPADATRPPAPLRLSADRRYLVDADGAPFFFLGDTAWSVVWKGTPDQWATYLDRRREQGFSVLQVNLLPWRSDLVDVDGNPPFVGGDVSRPNDAYFARYDRFIELAAARGLFTCLMLIWGGPRPELPASWFSDQQALDFAAWAVRRYTRFPMIWSISGDGPYDEDAPRWEAVGALVEAIDPNGHPTTNHMMTNRSWRLLHHAAPWHDFHMIQTGHYLWSRGDIADQALAAYRREPTKAWMNGEPWYEAHPDMSDRPRYGPLFGAEHQRYAFWVSVLSGATLGHTYGGQGIWNWKRPGDDESHLAGPQIGPTWREGLELPGAAQVALAAGIVRRLPWHRLRPSPERARAADPTTPRVRQPACARVASEAGEAGDRALWLTYLPVGCGAVELLGIDDRRWRARWIDARTGREQAIGRIAVPTTGVWASPAPPDGDDWVLLLEAVP